MTAITDKKALWKLIRDEHPDFARELQVRRRANDDQIRIDGYQEATDQWLMRALKHANPALVAFLDDEILPGKVVFESVSPVKVEIAITEMIEALLAFESVANAA